MAPSERGTILIVDDEPRNRDLVRILFRSKHDILEAEDGPSALRLVGGHRIDLVLMDVRMPGMDGFELCRRFKETSADGYLPIVLISALEDSENRNRGLAEGADDYLTKPMDTRQVELRVEHFLRLRRQDQIIRKQMQELKALEALRKELTTLVVHDLQHPLSSLLAAVSFMKESLETSLSEKGREYLSVALESSRRLKEEVEAILAADRLEGGAPLDPEKVSLRTVVEAAAATVRGASLLSRVKVEVRCAGAVDAVVDPKVLQRAVENLLSNALRHSPEGSTVTAHVVEEAGGVSIRVEDQGPGVPPELRDSLFERYGSVAPRMRQARRGFGLGLYSVHLACRAHGGKVSVKDCSEGGASFRIDLPGSVWKGVRHAASETPCPRQ
jgi:two-component system, sensor histidine kinase and response regulator